MELLCIDDVVIDTCETAFKKGIVYNVKKGSLPAAIENVQHDKVFWAINELGFIHYLGESINDSFMKKHFSLIL